MIKSDWVIPDFASFSVCALTYVPSSQRRLRHDSQIALLAVEHHGGVSFFVNENAFDLVEPNDRIYIKALFRDLSYLAHRRPTELFARLSSLNSGPLVTGETWLFERSHIPGDGIHTAS